ncbi:MAG: cytochrome-c peroxidase, partial [Myxococcota bacterium]|nr:cytochrome-c peroxidase [Myxococcota bacterium]
MLRKHCIAGAVWFACVGCNNAPPVPDNPLSVGAPDFGVTKTLAVAPPPISGGTMLLSRDGKTAIAADPDRDLISFVDLAGRAVRAQAALSPGDEPGRLVEDGGGRVHVALRGSGELATLSLATGQLLERRPVCPQPRGVAYDGTTDQVIVACATGELVTFPAPSGSAVRSLAIEPDLRDVVVDGDTIFVSKFRTAEILSLTRSGVISNRTSLPVNGSGALPAMAWRMRATADHQLAVSYQLDAVGFLPTTPGGYGNSGSGAIVRSAVANISMVDMTNIQSPSSFDTIVLPVDLAIAPSTPTAVNNAVLVGAGNWKSKATSSYASVGPFIQNARRVLVDGQLIAAELGQDGTLLLQSREPALLHVVQPGGGSQDDTILATITLSDVSREDTGHTIFHTNSGGSLACASCHGEGGDDAQTWNFDGKKPRRTPSLLGTVKDTAPYHWDADFRDLQALSHEV